MLKMINESKWDLVGPYLFQKPPLEEDELIYTLLLNEDESWPFYEVFKQWNSINLNKLHVTGQKKD